MDEPTPDDLTIGPAARLLRRIPKSLVYVMDDGGSRPASGAFKTKKGEGLSVYVEEALQERGLAPSDVLIGHEAEFFVVAITAGLIRECGLGVVWDPDDDDPILGEAHAMITGRINERAQRRMANECDQVIWI